MKQSYPDVTLKNHSNEQHGKICMLKKWHSCVGGNQQLSNWTSNPLHRKEIMPGTGKLTSCPTLMMPWLLLKNVTATLLHYDIFHYLLNLILILTGKYNYHFPFKSFFLPKMETIT